MNSNLKQSIILVFPSIPWGYYYQRPQQILSRLGTRGYPVLYLAPTTELPVHLDDELPCEFIKENVYHLWCKCDENIDLHSTALSDELLNTLSDRILSTLKHLEVDQLCLLVQQPFWLDLVLKIKQEVEGAKIVYDCMDDQGAFNANASYDFGKECLLINHSQAHIVSSQVLFDKLTALNQKPELIRNGADFEFFNESASCPEPIKSFAGKKIIGYYGSLEEWFDFELIELAATKKQDCQFVLIGNNSQNLSTEFENISLLGPVDYQELPAYLHSFDVCLIPFKVSPLTLATNPVKIYEYFSAGKPVIATKLPELEAFGDVCYLYEDENDFIANIESALAENAPSLVSQRQDIARENDWEQRVESFAKVLEGVSLFPQMMHSFYKLSCLAWSQLQRRVSLKDEDWQKEVNRIVKDYRAEIVKIGGEHQEQIAHIKAEQAVREQVIVDTWKDNLERVKASYENNLLIKPAILFDKVVRKLANKFGRKG